ncbi:hypothetical protein PTSG_09684 [Salpingoeca rosetta]|uniref:Uncharacterized protein n=1 Tax=Salpingoeca rosetta (strain ATCC 50818 / BSB-021) TaxID=946362 RepID=F2ULP7_SALR5|nr:uncharacterized protein PTSG_09684 [Salpingoeca rosetta]EGD78046.1 hypothetical protein PTSG_09684 [Salpingoeca rosetta]|eukprot:XP_004990108.1 hypothetical protein PTSG_09684 [Salpingoeca rosetta]
MASTTITANQQQQQQQVLADAPTEGLEPADVTPTPSCTNHHCSGGMNRRALPSAAHIPLSFSPSLTAITTTTTAAAANTPSTADAAEMCRRRWT